MKKVISLMWIVGMTVLLSAIFAQNILYLICIMIVGNTIAISSVALEEKYHSKS